MNSRFFIRNIVLTAGLFGVVALAGETAGGVVEDQKPKLTVSQAFHAKLEAANAEIAKLEPEGYRALCKEATILMDDGRFLPRKTIGILLGLGYKLDNRRTDLAAEKAKVEKSTLHEYTLTLEGVDLLLPRLDEQPQEKAWLLAYKADLLRLMGLLEESFVVGEAMMKLALDMKFITDEFCLKESIAHADVAIKAGHFPVGDNLLRWSSGYDSLQWFKSGQREGRMRELAIDAGMRLMDANADKPARLNELVFPIEIRERLNAYREVVKAEKAGQKPDPALLDKAYPGIPRYTF